MKSVQSEQVNYCKSSVLAKSTISHFEFKKGYKLVAEKRNKGF